MLPWPVLCLETCTSIPLVQVGVLDKPAPGDLYDWTASRISNCYPTSFLLKICAHSSNYKEKETFSFTWYHPNLVACSKAKHCLESGKQPVRASFHTKVKKPYFCQEHQYSVTAGKLGLMKDTCEVLQLNIHKNWEFLHTSTINPTWQKI